jgi:hypothetical protein
MRTGLSSAFVAGHLDAERVAEAVTASGLMLDPAQQQLPHELEMGL